MLLIHSMCYMYCSYSCCFSHLVTLTETCLFHRVLKGEVSISVITNSFFSVYISIYIYASSGIITGLTVSHFYFTCYNPTDAHPKTLTGVWCVTDTIINFTVCIHISEINLVVLWYEFDAISHPLWCISKPRCLTSLLKWEGLLPHSFTLEWL